MGKNKNTKKTKRNDRSHMKMKKGSKKGKIDTDLVDSSRTKHRRKDYPSSNKTQVSQTESPEMEEVKMEILNKNNKESRKRKVDTDIAIVSLTTKRREKDLINEDPSSNKGQICQTESPKTEKVNKQTVNNKINVGDQQKAINSNKQQLLNSKIKKINVGYIEDEESISNEEIDKFCDELSNEDNEQYEDWVKLIEEKLSNKKN